MNFFHFSLQSFLLGALLVGMKATHKNKGSGNNASMKILMQSANFNFPMLRLFLHHYG